ncbi:TonB-dependent receptor [Teredinibacter waterburyi]|jgi:TonB-dependent receptor|uniref:TonB-dependent receptor n=1 Tax=Teredinibacter waterburyi TaxID=1500538 RepID=A0A0D3MFC9_9GAMM|nr:TonB-dependent receptor [Teredinibacter waterburyi]AIH07633.1 TonB-dependent receptor [Teredinibacter waterburyi]
MKKMGNFRKKVLASQIASIVLAGMGASAFAQNVVEEEVIVTGVRAAQERAIDIKRNATNIVDSVSAEDIGKLPDVTIADSLQRITGVQIKRSGGQGSLVSVRGMSEVLSTVNGEYFLLPASMTTNGADFTDIPSSLVSGLTVSKSQSASSLDGGIGGNIDLLTARSLNMDEGFSGSARLQLGTGSITSETDPELSALVGWNLDDKLATSLAISYGDSTLANNQGRMRSDRVAESWGCTGAAGDECYDLDGNGDMGGDFINPMNWQSPEFSSRQIERERLGLVYNFNLAVSDALELNADVFYNSMEERSAGQFLYLGNQIGGRAGFHEYVKVTGNNAINNPGDGTLGGQPYYATDMNMMVSGFVAGVKGIYRDTSATNSNIELKYDNGGAFTGSVRWVSGHASSTSNDLTLSQISNARDVVRSEGGTAENINPGAIDDGLIYPMSVKLQSDSVLVNIDEAMVAKMANQESWYIHSGWVEGAYSGADHDIFRADGSFALADEGITSIDFGVRFSNRDVNFDNVSFFSPSGLFDDDGNELLNKYHEAGYAVGQAGTTGTAEGVTYDPLPVIQLEDSALNGYVTNVTSFGEVLQGFNGTVPMVDTNAISDPIAFLDELYGEGEAIVNPDRSYSVTDSKTSFFVQANFEKELSDSVMLTGNGGVRHVRTDLKVTQNITDPNSLNPRILAGVDPNHTTYTDLGDKVTNVSYNHFLPTLNLAFDFGENYKLRLAYDERISLQNLSKLGDGSITYYSTEETLPNGDKEAWQRVSSRQNNGNPYLRPWEATTQNIAFEWYPNDSTIVAIGYFDIDIQSFTYDKVEQNPALADSDGVVRRGAEERTIANGEGGSVQGWEFSYQQSFDTLPSILGNTGMTFNYTYSPSESPSDKTLPNGDIAPFNSTAEDQANLILWYQDDKLELRLAANYLGEQYTGDTSGWMWSPANDADGMPQYLNSTMFVDLSGSYYITDEVQMTLSVNNLTEEDNIAYTQWSDYVHDYDLFERRMTLGVNVKF